ncbi:C6 zinc finger domain-containing protein [Arthroderma uncinatum]|uniref:C6 zinc finger domain-containing protein n=1 Tax=Arthroderma uncinatum TaxID=74035 RepID=UPI00144A6B23|nr:C6 zinc finger domain-containing protein [Arthroderma uncinatum]KAF3492142.1 C6 zinc finger domain-containing protein [Arthroderma uncinatum]
MQGAPVPAESSSQDDTNIEISHHRKVRKGTRSCWECKRRKMKCSFSTPGDSVCQSCRRRGASCVSQKYPEEIAFAASPSSSALERNRIVRVEALVERLARKVGVGDDLTGSEDMTRRAVSSAPSASADGDVNMAESNVRLEKERLQVPASSPVIPSPARNATTRHGNIPYDKISAALYAAMPPQEDIHLMIEAGIDVSLHKVITHPYPVLANQGPGGFKGSLGEIPSPTTHPVLLAKYLFELATCLQYLHPELHADEIKRLSEPPRQLMRRLADTVIALVTSNDELLDSIEGLECIMLESSFEANSGHLRRAWLACRRAMLVAQMMGLHRRDTHQLFKAIDSSRLVYPSFFWFRIVCTDRQSCLMLGLPQGSLDVSMASPAAITGDTIEGMFERKQCVIAGRILELNQAAEQSAMDNLEALHMIDADLQAAGNEMPSKWWLVPNLASVVRDPDKTFWETIRLFDQMLYFNLLNLLHLPYMLRSQAQAQDTATAAKYGHSKLASANASRELLTRFIMFRSFNRVAFALRSIDFFALVAAMTLVIAHLDGHRQQRQHQQHGGINILAHQRNSDRAMIEQVLENMEGVAKLNTDVLSDRASGLLKTLLAFETDAAKGNIYRYDYTTSLAMTELQVDSATATDDGQFLRIGIPYFGTVRLNREGVVSMEQPTHDIPPASQPSPPPSTQQRQQHLPTDPGSNDAFQGPSSASQAHPQHLGAATVTQPCPSPPTLSTRVSNTQLSTPLFTTTIDDTVRHQYLYPGLTVGADDWAFQGVDMAFFDSLINHLEGGNVNADDFGSWTEWE